jgi:hypothetical protein
MLQKNVFLRPPTRGRLTSMLRTTAHRAPRLWLLTFSLSGPAITLFQLRAVGGFRLDECCITCGICHRFVLLVFHGDDDGLRCVQHFMLRMRRECGVCSDAWPGYGSAVSDRAGRDGKRVWTHPGFQLVADRRRRADSALSAWAVAAGCRRRRRSGTREALRAVRSRIRAALELLAPDEKVGCVRRRRCPVVAEHHSRMMRVVRIHRQGVQSMSQMSGGSSQAVLRKQ